MTLNAIPSDAEQIPFLDQLDEESRKFVLEIKTLSTSEVSETKRNAGLALMRTLHPEGNVANSYLLKEGEKNFRQFASMWELTKLHLLEMRDTSHLAPHEVPTYSRELIKLLDTITRRIDPNYLGIPDKYAGRIETEHVKRALLSDDTPEKLKAFHWLLNVTHRLLPNVPAEAGRVSDLWKYVVVRSAIVPTPEQVSSHAADFFERLGSLARKT
jgi:hypothetical protein